MGGREGGVGWRKSACLGILKEVNEAFSGAGGTLFLSMLR